MYKTLCGLSTLAVLWLSLVWPAQAADTLSVGSKRFTESLILAEVIAQTAAPHLLQPPVVKLGLGNTAIVYAALRSGAIDVYAEYSGTIALEILKSPKPMSLAAMNQALAPLGLAASYPLGFNNGYALAMRAQDAEQLGIKTLADLARHPQLKLGLSNEFLGRADGWPGLAKAYALTAAPTALDHGLAYEAMAAKQIDVIDIYTTDAKIDQLGLRVLQDDRNYFPKYDALLLHRLDVPKRFSKAWLALAKMEGSISERTMIGMNAQAELSSMPFDAIAKAHLSGTTATAQRNFAAKLFGSDLTRLTGQHLLLVVASVGLAVLLAIPLAVLVFPHPRLRAAVLAGVSLLQTVPSLALLAVVISVLGSIGFVPALIALTLYSLLPIMRNTVTGMVEVSDGLRMAASAVGMTRAQAMRYVELPLALPTILAGVRVATAIAIGTATLAAFVGAGGYGERIVTGLALNDRDLLLAGAIPAAAFALLSEAVFELLERMLKRPA